MEVDPVPMPPNPTPPPNNYTPVMKAISSMANVPEFRILKQLIIAQIRMLLPGTGSATHVTKRVLIVQLLQCKLQKVADTFPNFRATMAKTNLPGVTNMAQLKAATAVGHSAILISKINLLRQIDPNESVPLPVNVLTTNGDGTLLLPFVNILMPPFPDLL